MNNHIQDCIDNIHYSDISKTMAALKWQWATIGTPTKEQMIDTIRYLYSMCVKQHEQHGKGEYTSSTGGFSVVVVFGKTKVKGVRVVFEITGWESYE